MRTSETLSKIAPALVAAISSLRGATKDATNPHFRNDYASLESVIEASRDILADNGLCVIQAPGPFVDGRLSMTTRILHTSGEWIESEFHMPLVKADPQGTGSAVTYARRYALMAALNLAAVDDDGEAAQGRTAPSQGHSEPIQQRDLGVGPEGKDFWKCEGSGPSAYQAKKDGLDGVHEQMRQDILKLHTDSARREWIEANLSDIQKMPRSWRVILRADLEEQAQMVQA